MVPSSGISAPSSIVVVEDEVDILDVVEYNLQREGYDVRRATDGKTGLALVRDALPDLVVLDLMLPELDGVEVCRQMRMDPATTSIPVIMLTAKGDESDIVLGLGVGADDYVTKPFSPKELVARVKAVLRRPGADVGAAAASASADGDGRVERAGLVVDPSRHEVTLDGKALQFTRTELRLLHVLAVRPGRVYERDELVSRVMGENAWITERTIDVHVRAIRKKLGARSGMVETVRGVGYRLVDAQS